MMAPRPAFALKWTRTSMSAAVKISCQGSSFRLLMRPYTTLNALVFLVDVIAKPRLEEAAYNAASSSLLVMYRNLGIQLNKIFGIFISR